MLRTASISALRILDVCPLLPVSVFARLARLAHLSAAYDQLSRLEDVGLAARRRVDLGHLVATRPLDLWSITLAGRDALRTAGVLPILENPAARARLPYGPPETTRDPARQLDVPLLVASYRVLEALLMSYSAAGTLIEVVAWEHPWVRSYTPVEGGVRQRVSIPAAAVLARREDSYADDLLSSVLLLPDLGTAPLAANRELLRRLVRLQATTRESGAAGADEPLLVIGTSSTIADGRRNMVWTELLSRAAERLSEPRPQAQVVVVPGIGGGRPQRRHHQMLDLVGRHPFLTGDQLAGLLGLGRNRVQRLRAQLVDRGLLRLMGSDDPAGALSLPARELVALGFAELTPAGRRALARTYGLTGAVASRHQGLIGGERGRAGRRRSLLRSLAHTLGVNDVFVAIALAGCAATEQGGDEALDEWRGAAACARRHCRPDGYGVYRRGAARFGFMVEFDRGTERLDEYVAKFDAYYAYRDSGQADRDYDGFPTLLCITTDPGAEGLMADACVPGVVSARRRATTHLADYDPTDLRPSGRHLGSYLAYAVTAWQPERARVLAAGRSTAWFVRRGTPHGACSALSMADRKKRRAPSAPTDEDSMCDVQAQSATTVTISRVIREQR